jgi:DeoR/GlpR family transcriptional regulator of sugar metabolism
MDRVFVAVCGIDAARGVTSLNRKEVPLFRAMIGQAKQAIVLADSSKLGVVSPAAVLSPPSQTQMLRMQLSALSKNVESKPSRTPPRRWRLAEEH